MKDLQAIVRILQTRPGPGYVLATLVSVSGSSYRRPGARLLVTPDGRRIGSISGGCLEEDVLARAAQVQTSGIADAVVYDTTSENDLVWGVGLGCHGVVWVLIERLPALPAWVEVLAENFVRRRETIVTVRHHGDRPDTWGTRLAASDEVMDSATDFVETILPPTALFIFGAGDDAQPLARFADELGWEVTVADPRGAFVTEVRFPRAVKRIVGLAAELVNRAAPGADGLAVVMTHHYVHDVPILGELLQRPLRYVGLLGPRKRAEKILHDLGAAGVKLSPEQRQKLHAPVGLDLGADTPEQVALSMLAEMQATLAQRDGRPLRERTRPIHA